MYYSASENAKLFMGESVATPLPLPVADAFNEVPLTGSIKPPPNTRSTAGFNVTNDGARRSIGGKIGDQAVAGNVVLDWTDDTVNDLYDDSVILPARKRNWYLLYPNGRRLDFAGFISQWEEAAFEGSDTPVEHRADFTVTIDGGVTATNPAP